MTIQTTLIQSLLYANMAGIVFLFQPYLSGSKAVLIHWYLRSRSFATLCHVLYALYFMVFLVFLDSIFRISTLNSPVLLYQSERNFYLSGFSLFAAFIFGKACSIMSRTLQTEEANKFNMKQHGNSMTFVNKVIEDAKAERERSERLAAEIESLRETISRNEGLIADIDNNRQAYLKLKDKYEKLKEARVGESRKTR